MNPLIFVYDFHKKKFGLQDNTFLRLFEALLSTSPCSILECSVKISPQGTHAGRLRLGYGQQDIQEGLHTIYDFLHDIARSKKVRLSRSMLSQIINNEDTNNSKVKCYLLLGDYPEKVDQILSLHPPIDGIRDYLVHKDFGVGIAMYFDGRTSIEIYPYLERQDLNNAALMDKLKLRDVLRVLIEEFNLRHISFEEDGRRLLHFNPQHPTRFVHVLNNRQLSLAYSHVQIMNYILSQSYQLDAVSVALCLVEDEILAKDIKNISLHYGLSSPRQTKTSRNLDEFYSAESPEEWKLILGDELHYHHGYFSAQEDFLIGQRQTVINFYPEILRGAKVLDAGCGWGGPAVMLKKDLKCAVHGITISSAQADYCRRLPIEVTLSDLERDPIAGRYDIVFMLEALYHIRDKRGVLVKLRNCADRLLLSTHCVAEDYTGIRMMFAESGGTLCKTSELERYLQDAGWRIREIRNRSFQAIPTIHYWKKNFDQIYADQKPPGHLGILRDYVEDVVISLNNWCRTYPLIDVVAD
jgi:LynF/TruF/PatF family peptide O-prenyltransferase